MTNQRPEATPGPPTPTTFLGFLRSMGPGIVVVLTWLGAGDIVEVGVAGANYGYALMWVLVLAIGMRFVFVSIIAKYHLLNERGETVLDGLHRLHPLYAPLLLVASIVMGHIYGAYMTVGLGECLANLFGFGPTWLWAGLCAVVGLIIVGQSVYGRVEACFKILLALLSVSFLGCAIWIGPSAGDIVEGTLAFRIPEDKGTYGSLLVAVGMIGAVAGSLMNLVYPYFLDEKGWKGPHYRRLQLYDLVFAIAVMIVLDLSIWVLGAEVLHPQGLTVSELDDFPRLLSSMIGNGGRVLFYLGIFAAIYTSLIGHARGLASLGTHAYQLWRTPAGENAAAGLESQLTAHPLHRYIVAWILLSPLVWTFFGDAASFVPLTLTVQSLQVLLIPFLAGGIWWITANSRYIGERHRNVWWENLFLAVLAALALWAAWQSIIVLLEKLALIE
jgi:Mn2+/Fe2+ NRAMP family transporter